MPVVLYRPSICFELAEHRGAFSNEYSLFADAVTPIEKARQPNIDKPIK